MNARLRNGLLRDILHAVPDDLLMDAPEGTEPPFATPDENRDAYCRYFEQRLDTPRAFVEEAEQARQLKLNEQPEEKRYRR
jgi:hypothetical protein